MTRPRWGGKTAAALTVAVLARDGGVCYWCGGVASTFDHYPVARVEGGADDLANGVASCRLCNQKRGGELTVARRLPPPPSRQW